jgi:hypothetical protein
VDAITKQLLVDFTGETPIAASPNYAGTDITAHAVDAQTNQVIGTLHITFTIPQESALEEVAETVVRIGKTRFVGLFGPMDSDGTMEERAFDTKEELDAAIAAFVEPAAARMPN